MKRVATSFLTLTLVLVGIQPSLGETFDFPQAASVPPGTVLIAVNEPNTFDAWNQWSAHESGEFTTTNSYLCPEGIDEDKCDPRVRKIILTSILSVCESEEQQYCVESLKMSSTDGRNVTASFIRGVDGYDYEAEDQGAIPAGEISLWRATGVNHLGGGDEYSVLAKVTQEYDLDTGRFKAVALSANVSPFIARANGESPVHGETAFADGTTKVTTRHSAECIWADSSGCGLPVDFAEGVQITLTIRYPSEVLGWFRGRLEDPTISISPISANSNRLVLQAKPVVVPRIMFSATELNTSDRVREILRLRGGKGFNPDAGTFDGGQIKDFFSNEGEQLFEVIQEMRESASDTAAGASTLWSFTTMENYGNNPCFANQSEGVLGLVTTNASAYRGDPPEFESNQLSYKVAGLHFAPDGQTVNRGTYDLVMRSDVARCLYGFSKAPVSAKVQVLNEQGEEVVATSVVSERDGWLKLAAYGFTFSEKEIKVQISQSQVKTLSDHPGRATALTAKQKSEIRGVLAKSSGNTKFICTGVRLEGQSQAMNLVVRKRAKLACDYAKSIRPDLSYWYQTKTTKARSYNGRVLVVSK